MTKRIYLAGPEVFLANSCEAGARKRAICEQHGATIRCRPCGTPGRALRAFPSWFLRIVCECCGKDRMIAETHMPPGMLLD